MSKVEQLNKYTTIKQGTSADRRQLGPLVQDRGSDVSMASQTTLDLSFSVDQTDAHKKSFFLMVDGAILTEGASNDFVFSNVINGRSSQVTFNAPLSAGLNISYWKVGVAPMSSSTAGALQAQLDTDVGQPKDWAFNGFTDSVKVEEYEVPYSTFPNIGTIEGRSKIKYGNLAPVMGIERLAFGSMKELQSEKGPNGEIVHAPEIDDDRIRFVGKNVATTSSSWGTRVSITNGSYCEVTFFGTGLNILTFATNAHALLVTVDDGTEGTDIHPTMNGLIGGRNYPPNVVLPVVSGLDLGWHTVKMNTSTSNGFVLFGLEIITEATQIKISDGIGWSGCLKQELAAISSTDYNAGVSGVKGARVVKYLLDGEISQAVQEVDATAKYLTNTDHTNEELIRKIYFKEFSMNRGDDFSQSSASTDAAYVLNDGVTTLVANDCGMQTGWPNHLYLLSNTGFLTITFVGTGLGVHLTTDSTGRYIEEVSIDGGASVGSFYLPANSGEYIYHEVCSGLPYGTHTVTFKKTNTNPSLGFSNFFIYGPKKPSIPEGAVEICDYNVMANYVANSSGGLGPIATGVLRKFGSREMIYVGTNMSMGLSTADTIGGFSPTIITSTGQYIEYTFFGTGFESRWYANTTGFNAIQVTLDDTITDFSSYTTSVYGDGSLSFTASTGILSQAASGAAPGSGFTISGLPLGVHKVRMTSGGSGTYMRNNCFDIITPIHINRDLFIGSLGLIDSRNFSPIPKEEKEIDISKPKAWLYYDQTTSQVINSYNISSVLNIGTGNDYIYPSVRFKGKIGMLGLCYDGNCLLRTRTQIAGQQRVEVLNERPNDVVAENHPYFIALFGELENE